MSAHESSTVVSHLTCRQIQAPLVSALIQGFSEELGEERALGIARKVIRADAIRSGRALADRYSDGSLRTLLRVVQEVWAADGTMDVENVRLSGDTLEFDVTRCGYAELYERLGLRSLGCVLSCERDFSFMDGFNPEIRLQRTRTIMEGGRSCDFRYRTRPGEGQGE